ncbi:hybrid sensor histidine kinase/response regulator [Pelagicoccus mobilis]|uniref:histidine kinase n=1 Tax=Pelagicoccus mobilis TaxID=415221 RepID=A0A934RVS3_9BACT|nr:hybrid sensor histidine kinase/response regulator [Pelagicoccus mobilis]MBK1876059.1 response regulator [Pelagicoccus mobilis]
MIKYPRVLIVVLLSFWGSSLMAQLTFNHLETDIGIALIRDMHRDRDGNLWIATRGGGAMKFDGYAIKQYQNEEENPGSLSDNFVTEIHRDLEGNIWIGTRRGVNRYDEETDSFEHYYVGSKEGSSTSGEFIVRISENKSEGLLVLTHRQLSYYDSNTDTFRSISPEVNENESVFFTDFQYRDTSRLWLLTSQNDIWEVDLRTDSVKKTPLFDHQTSSEKIFFKDSFGTLWIASQRYGLYEFFPDSLSVRSFPTAQDGTGPNGTNIADLLEYPRGTLMVAVDQGGLNLMDLETRRFSYQSKALKTGRGLSSDGVLSLYADEEGILWLGTSRSGVDFFNPKMSRFRTYRSDPYLPMNSLADNVVGCVYEGLSGRIFIGTDGGGVSVYDPRKDTFQNIKVDPEDRNYLPTKTIRKIDQKTDGSIWVATWDKGICALIEEEGEFLVDTAQTEKLSRFQNTTIWDMEIDEKDRIWIAATSNHVYLVDRNLDQVRSFSEPRKQQLPHSPIVYELSGEIFMTGLYGLYKYNEEIEDFELFIELERPSTVVQDPNSKGYFVGSFFHGVGKYNEDGELLKEYKTEAGLPDNLVRSIQVTDDDELWVGTEEGLCRIMLGSGISFTYYEKDGLQGNQYFIDASCKARDGTLYFGGTNGLSAFDPKDLVPNPVLPNVRIDRISLSGQELRHVGENRLISKHPQALDQLNLDWEQNFLSFGFTGISMTYPFQNKYAYMLEGFDDVWNYTDAYQRNATYTNLDPGTYIFRVKASNNDEVWNEKEARIRIEITPPFWMRVWFYVLVVGLLLVCIYGVFRYRERRLRRDREKLSVLVTEKTAELQAYQDHLEDLVENRTSELSTAKDRAEESDRLKSQFLANLSHEIRTPLNAVIGFSSLLQEKDLDESSRDGYIEVIGENSFQLLHLIEDILDFSILSANQMKISSSGFSLNEFCDQLYRTHRLKFEAKSIAFDYRNSLKSENVTIVSDRTRIKQVVDNLLSNACKFTDHGKVELSIGRKEDMLVFSVKDSGHGIPADEVDIIFERFVKLKEDESAARRGVGLGLAISKQLAELMGGFLEVESEYGVGSVFSFSTPLEYDRPVGTFMPEPVDIFSSRQADLAGTDILVIEDERNNYLYIEAALKRIGIRTTWASSGEKGIEILGSENSFGLVLLDIKMPGMDGFQALEIIRKQNPEINVVAQTAYAREDDKRRIRNAGFDGYLSKPIDQKKLVAMIQASMG